MKYRKDDGKEGLLSFGQYPAVSLEQARRKRDEAKSQKAAGYDPLPSLKGAIKQHVEKHMAAMIAQMGLVKY